MESATKDTPAAGADQGELAGSSSTSTGAPAKAADDRTRYMVLWAKVPQEDDHEYRWLELGWYKAHSQAAARKAAGFDEESGQHGRIVDAAKQGPVQLRAIPESSWPQDVEASEVKTTHALVIR